MTAITFIITFFICLLLGIIAVIVSDTKDKKEQQEHKSKKRILLRWNYVNRKKLKRLQDVCSETFNKVN